MKNTFNEQYEIIYDYKKPDGFWAISAKETVMVKCQHGVNEKNNHNKAKEIFESNHPEARVHSVMYC